LGSGIAVIIAFYNEVGFLRKALDSVSKQSMCPDEIVVVDDGSCIEVQNELKQLCSLYEVRLVNKQNGGQSSARNLGVASTRAPLVSFLDQDDQMFFNHLETLYRAFGEGPIAEKTGFTYGGVSRVDTEGNLLQKYFGPTFDFSKDLPLAKCLGRNLNVLPSALMIRREAFERVGGFDEALRGYEDDDLIIRLKIEGYRGSFAEQPIGNWLTNPGSSSNQETMHESKLLFYLKWSGVFESKDLTYSPSRPALRALNRRFGIALISALITSELGSNHRFAIAAHQLSVFKNALSLRSPYYWLSLSLLWGARAERFRALGDLLIRFYTILPGIYPGFLRRVIDRHTEPR
jgi:glycosyltransferase involved in cell wall biosynthesis